MEVSDDRLKVVIANSSADPSYIRETLIIVGVRLLEFREDGIGLEDLFLRVTKGETQKGARARAQTVSRRVAQVAANGVFPDSLVSQFGRHCSGRASWVLKATLGDADDPIGILG